MKKFYSTANAEDTADLDLLFLLEDLKYKEILDKHSYNVALVVAKQKIEGYNTIISSNPKETFWKLHNSMKEEKIPTKIGKNCKIGKNVYINPYNVEIGDNCIIGNNVSIGCDGFQVVQLDGKNELIKHFGKVKIGNDCIIKNNCIIDRGLFKQAVTTLKENVILDTNVCVSHNTILEDKVIVSAGTVFGGYSYVGENTFIGINSATKQLVHIGKNNIIGMGSNLIENTEDNEVICGYKATTLEEGKRRVRVLTRKK